MAWDFMEKPFEQTFLPLTDLTIKHQGLTKERSPVDHWEAEDLHLIDDADIPEVVAEAEAEAALVEDTIMIEETIEILEIMLPEIVVMITTDETVEGIVTMTEIDTEIDTKSTTSVVALVFVFWLIN